MMMMMMMMMIENRNEEKPLDQDDTHEKNGHGSPKGCW
jgi:hypothetical protein